MNVAAFQSGAFQSNAFQFATVTRSGSPSTIALGSLCCCSETGTGTCTCNPCPVCRTEFNWLTITASTGNMFDVWVGAATSALGATPFTTALTTPNGCNGRSVSFSDVESCGGLLTNAQFQVCCTSDTICMSVSFLASCDVTCLICIPDIDGDECIPSGFITITMSGLICDAFGFVSIDFAADCGIYGTFSGTIYR